MTKLKLEIVFCLVAMAGVSLASASELLINSLGQGASPKAAIAAARNQARQDAEEAGHLTTRLTPSAAPDRPRTAPRVISVSRLGPALYEATVEMKIASDEPRIRVAFVSPGTDASSAMSKAVIADLERNTAPTRQFVVIPGHDPVAQSLLARINGARLTGNPPPANGTVLDILCVVAIDESPSALGYLTTKVYFVDAQSAEILKLQTLRSPVTTNTNQAPSSLIAQITLQLSAALTSVIAETYERAAPSKLLTISSPATSLSIGQSVVIYEVSRSQSGTVVRSLPVTTGEVVSVGTSSTKTVTKNFISSSGTYSVKPLARSKNGVVISESDW